mgnify:CR=1 FL=1
MLKVTILIFSLISFNAYAQEVPNNWYRFGECGTVMRCDFKILSSNQTLSRDAQVRNVPGSLQDYVYDVHDGRIVGKPRGTLRSAFPDLPGPARRFFDRFVFPLSLGTHYYSEQPHPQTFNYIYYE